MHMADALVSPAVAGTMVLAAGAAAGYSIYKIRQEDDPKKIPEMGILGAFVFAAQMINFTIPGTGSSGHLCGGMLLTAILGPFAGFVTMIGVLLIQCLFFADGGLLALGCNVWNMAFYGCFIGALIWKAVTARQLSRGRIAAASILGSVLTLQLGAFSVTLETLASGVTALPFGAFVLVMQPIHLAIGLVEGLITAAVLCFVAEARPEILWRPAGTAAAGKTGRLTWGQTLGLAGCLSVVTALGLSKWASADPDGLEWSMARLTGSSELMASGPLYDLARRVQEATAFLPDYAPKDGAAMSGTVLSTVIGGAVVLCLVLAGCYLFRFMRSGDRPAREAAAEAGSKARLKGKA
jgi:cobalt/nickel transport system permease protein